MGAETRKGRRYMYVFEKLITTINLSEWMNTTSSQSQPGRAQQQSVYAQKGTPP